LGFGQLPIRDINAGSPNRWGFLRISSMCGTDAKSFRTAGAGALSDEGQRVH
jgi:hypothetical protein